MRAIPERLRDSSCGGAIQVDYTFTFYLQDWRDHVDQMHQYSDAIESCMHDTRGQLERLADDIGRTLEKIASRERYVNQELHYQLNGLKTAQDRRAERKETYRQASVGLADKSRYLAEVWSL